MEHMSPAEREEELRELEERFGSSVLDALRRRATARSLRPSDPLTPALGSRPDSVPKAGEPASSRPPRPRDDPPDAADLKAKYFPDVPSEPDKLAWMTPAPSSSANSTSVRFDLSGRPLTAEQSESLSTSRGLHHHGDQPDLAGYTMDEILWLSRSTVPGQRVTMLGVLTRILEQYINHKLSSQAEASVEEAKGVETGLQLAIMGLQGRGASLLRASVDLLFVCIEGDGQTGPNLRTADRALIPYESLIPILMDLISTHLLPRAAAEKTIAILSHFIVSDSGNADLMLPNLPQVVRAQVFDRPWPYEASAPLSTQAMRLLLEVIDGSRTSAELVVSDEMHTSLLKFLIPSLWGNLSDCSEMATLTLRVFTSLARYGLASSTAIAARDIFADLSIPLAELREDERPTSELQAAYWDLLAAWTTCAIDPHRTTPEHDLTWAQVDSLAWVEQALGRLSSGAILEGEALGALLWFLVAWCEGLRINTPNHGETEIARVAQAIQSSTFVQKQLAGDFQGSSRTVAALVRLDRLFRAASASSGKLLATDIIARLQPHKVDKTWARSIEFDALAQSTKPGGEVEWSKRAFTLLSAFRPGDEPLALDLVDSLLASSRPSRGDVDLVLLRPLSQHTILPNVKNVIAPIIPHHLYLKSTSAIRPLISSPAAEPANGKSQGLPLRQDWVFSALDELLRSADSEALKVAQSLPGWNFTETEVVRSTLHLALQQCHAFPPGFAADQREDGSVQTPVQGGMTRTEVLLGLMKVFMLEHNQGTTSGQEIFRDSVVEQALSNLLAYTTRRVEHPSRPVNSTSDSNFAPLESTSSTALDLGSAPFFQFYSDLVGLSTTTFPHPVLSALLVVPLSEAYAKDYRLAVWADDSALRQIKIPASAVPLERANGLEAFFVPPEKDPDVLGAYCRALGKGWVRKDSGFMWDQAVYHIGRFLWSGAEVGGVPGERRTMMGALMLRAPEDVVRALVQRSEDWSEPESVGSDELQRRLGMVRDFLGSEGVSRVESICKA